MARIIRRYSNRRLYDTLSKRNITLDDFLKILESGEEVTVVDHRTGRDITEDTVAKALLLKGERGAKGFWLSLFAFMRDRGASFFKMGRHFGGFFIFLERKTGEFLSKMVRRGMLTESDEETLKQLFDGRIGEDDKTRALLNRLVKEAFRELGVIQEKELKRLSLEIEALKGDIERLREKLHDLEKRLNDKDLSRPGMST